MSRFFQAVTWLVWMPNWPASWAVVRSPLAAARATLALKAAANTHRFPLIVRLRKGCPPPSELHLQSAPENWCPPQSSRRSAREDARCGHRRAIQKTTSLAQRQTARGGVGCSAAGKAPTDAGSDPATGAIGRRQPGRGGCVRTAAAEADRGRRPLRRRCPQGLVGERGASSAAARDTAEQRLPSNRSVPGRESGDRRGRALPHDRHATLRPFRWSSVMQPFIAPSDGSRHLPSAKPEPIARCFCQSRQTLNTRLEASPSTSCFDWHRASCPSGKRGTDR